MLEIRIDLSDVENFTKNLSSLNKAEIERAAGIALYESANIFIVPRAMEFAPTRTGYLRNNIYTKMVGPTSVSIFSDVPYAGYQEFGFFHVKGRRDIPGQYFVQNAIVEALPEVTSRIANTIEFEVILKNIRR